MALSMLPVGLDSRRRRLVVGRRLRLLQMARTARAGSAVSAGKSAVLVVSASVSAADSSSNANTDSARSMLVLRELPGRSGHARRMSRARRSMLSDPGRSAPSLQRSLLVLPQRSHPSNRCCAVQRARRTVFFLKRRSAAALRTTLLVLHQRSSRAGSGGRLPRARRSMFWFARRSGQKLSSTPDSNSAAATNPDPADHLYPRRSTNAHSATGSTNADAFAKTWQSNPAEDLHCKSAGHAFVLEPWKTKS